MLEVNDFNAIRLSLASNAQIRSWSYGEVTKPETINYRTLKPEKDGLFCEKIFGPTKDFECHCGKYKRARYKGIVCDKCGVEVARSKVRRERMGHISLAAPVAHIWFSKGVPSRLGLLLDVPPRTLERVLYFSHYVITEVNDEARSHALELLQLEVEDEVARREGEAGGRIAVREQALEQEVSEVDGRVESELALCEEDLARLVDEIMSEARELERDLRAREGEKLRAKLAFRGEALGARGATIGSGTLAALTEAAERAVGGVEEQIASRKSDLLLSADAERQQRRDAAFTELEPLRAQVAEVREAVRKEYEPLVKWLERLRDPVEADALTVLAESEFRDREERFGLVFKAGMGAEAILSILERVDLAVLREKLQTEIDTTGGQRQKKATKRLRIVESLRKAGNRPDWMVVQELPVLPPDLRPMVQLDGGRFATSDLNDLYRRVINRNNRLKRLLKLGAPEIIIRNEKRMLQEAVDSLIDNGRRGRAVSGSGNHKLKSLSDLLKGKQGRFRQNLLGKRVDYSGRSVIIVGPTLKLHECGLPKKMALELFKPFVMHALVRSGLAHNIKSAKRIVERAQPEVWDVLEEVIRERPVLLNRAPTLHRLGIQAFEPTLVEGSAIQLHPLVCFAYNADFDGDQMAVHVPLSYEAVAEARQVMLSTKNLLSPSDGEPVVAPTLDMVLGCYYMTYAPDAPAEPASLEAERPKAYADVNEVRLAYTLQQTGIHDRIRVRVGGDELVETTVGRILFHEVVPEGMGFQNRTMDKKALRELVSRVYLEKGPEVTADVVDAIKNIGFRYATQSGLTISSSDISVPREKERLMGESDRSIDAIEEQFQMGLVTAGEKRAAAINVWSETTAEMQQVLTDSLDPEGPLAMMSNSGAKGNIAQIRQMAGFRGLMSDPSGRIIELPIRSSFKEGLTVLEYFISTHGARKGLADTALRTADSGYLTRRMIDVAQDLIISVEDCVSEGDPVPGIWLRERAEQGLLASLEERITGRWSASPVAHPETGEVLVESNTSIVEETASLVVGSGVERVHVRSPLTCLARRGICRRCYGRSLATGQLVEPGVAVGIIAAQSIGEPGTQLTMRTFHTGGVAGLDITSGLPRVEEIFEARVPKGQAVLSEVDGLVQVERDGDQRQIRVSRTETVSESYELPEGYTLLVSEGDVVDPEQPLAQAPDEGGEEPAASGSRSRRAKAPARAVVAGLGGRVEFDGEAPDEGARTLRIVTEVADVREYPIAANARVRVESGAFVHAGEQLTEGALDPQAVLAILGPEAVQVYLVDEVQRVYRSQGVNINDRHIEVIVRQMMRRIRVEEPGDSELLRSELVDRWTFDEMNARVVSEQGAPAAGVPVLLGVTKASLSTDSFLAAASFQETTRVLTDAAISGATDHLRGLKENVIIGKLIPARAQVTVDRPAPIAEMAMPESLLLPFAFDFEREAMYGATPSIFELGEEIERELVGGTPVSYVADPD